MPGLGVALDWTPNTNHSGFYVAQARGLYDAAGLAVELLSADRDGYATTPAQKVAEGVATVGVAPSESVISSQSSPHRPDLVAVAAVVQDDTSAIATLAGGRFSRPADLDGALYASYAARYEGAIVRELIRADGGRGELREVTPPKLGIWDTLLTGDADATWIFEAWEGVLARREGVELTSFRLADHGIPYGYSPVLLARADALDEALLRPFLSASAEGFRLAAEDPEAAADDLCRVARHPTLADRDFVRESQVAQSPHYLADGRWGLMDLARWTTFLSWLRAQGILGDGLDAEDLFTNALL